jgi:acetoacetate decarboxylase
MGFIKTPAELAGLREVLGAPRFVGGRQLKVEFLTDPSVIARLLPPPLEPAAEPIASVTVGRWHSNGVGSYVGASVYLSAAHEGTAGGYALTMWMDAEPPMMFGREVFGEPKKLADVRLERSGSECSATVERHGTRLVALRAELTDEREPVVRDRVAFNYRSRTSPDGAGLEGPAVLTRAVFTETITRWEEGRGAIDLRGTAHDPLQELPVVSVIRATYSEQDIAARCEAIATVPAEEFLPYHHGRTDNWLALDTSGAESFA